MEQQFTLLATKTPALTVEPPIVVDPSLPSAWFYVFQITCFLSMFGSATIIFTYVAFDDLRSTSRRLLAFLSIADFGTALANSVGMFKQFSDSSPGCKVQASIAIFFSLSSYFWTVHVAVFIYLALVKERQSGGGPLLVVFHLLAWGVPLVIVALAAGFKVLGVDQTAANSVRLNNTGTTGHSISSVTAGWCFLKAPNCTGATCHPSWYTKSVYKGWLVLTSVSWEILAVILCSVLYFRIKYHVQKEKRSFVTSGLRAAVNSIDRKLAFVPLVFFLLHVWSICRELLLMIDSKSTMTFKWLAILEGIGDCAQGLANCFVFCFFTSAVRKRLKVACILCWARIRFGLSSTRSRNSSLQQQKHQPDFQSYTPPLLSRSSSIRRGSDGAEGKEKSERSLLLSS